MVWEGYKLLQAPTLFVLGKQSTDSMQQLVVVAVPGLFIDTCVRHDGQLSNRRSDDDDDDVVYTIVSFGASLGISLRRRYRDEQSLEGMRLSTSVGAFVRHSSCRCHHHAKQKKKVVVDEKP
jgi:hypothetical protein